MKKLIEWLKSLFKKKEAPKKCDFTKLSKKQLLTEAEHRGVKVNPRMTKKHIVSVLENHK